MDSCDHLASRGWFGVDIPGFAAAESLAWSYIPFCVSLGTVAHSTGERNCRDFVHSKNGSLGKRLAEGHRKPKPATQEHQCYVVLHRQPLSSDEEWERT
jgi:hypothetical protein